MIVIEVSEGLIVKETITDRYHVEVFDVHESVRMWIDGNPTVLEPINKPSCEYTLNELKDYMRTMLGAVDVCGLRQKANDMFKHLRT